MSKRSKEESSSVNSPVEQKVVAFIPARGGSKSIPLKNIANFCGKPLLYWTLQAAEQAGCIDEIYVATDHEEIHNTVESFGFSKVRVISRSEESATDTASTESVMLEFAEEHPCSHIVLIQATSPLLEAADLTAAFAQYMETKADSLVSVVRQKRFVWEQDERNRISPLNYDYRQRPRRQDWTGYLVENGAMYITRRELLLATGCRISGAIVGYEMSEASYFELDEPSDWVIAEGLKMRTSPPCHFDRINLLVCDVDGVLTDAGMYYSTSGEEMKKFNTRDGKGIELLKQCGIHVMLLTSEHISVVERRGVKLHADYVHMGIKDKKGFLDKFYEEHPQYSFASTAYIGDDVNDLESMRHAYLAAAPSDASEQILRIADYVCTKKGGEGCVRELCDIIVLGRNHE
ncbi:N-acylneuraminate cytidylyltransferase [Paenibacillus athensensis]|uniref:N-acylneuraminate cytidylyltransferase n=1 Tax=Paenibacillus athensensis TaxID=1967502 RepID=A0A4Y8Q6L4_9BACL|nr:N-acylneuraminate cytidylyltransferase [Paenibacillus athensensis]MCD1259530.1 N-acylneuraminate cytidylyltransferase [Paenibacillus athensensis]